MLAKLSGPTQKPLSGGKPNALVVLLHGLGASGDDLIGLAPYLAQLLPDVEFLAPNAPFPCDMAPYGRQWFSLQDRNPIALFAGISASAPILNHFLDEALATRVLDNSRLALVGFSQGTMMALHISPRRVHQLAGVVGFSGALCGADHLKSDIRSRSKALLIHGDADPVVPFACLAAAEKALSACQVPVDTMVCRGLGHEIDQAGLDRAGMFLRGVIG